MQDFINISKKELQTKQDKKDFALCIAAIPVLGSVLYGAMHFIAWYAQL